MSDLTDRLRGTYRFTDKDGTVYERQFNFLPPIYGEVVAEIERLTAVVQAGIRDDRAIQQTLGKALGYPWYKDDLKSFPAATEADGVCVGAHVAATLAAEAADRIASLEADTTGDDISRLRQLEDTVKRVLSQAGDDHCWRDTYTEMASLVGVEFHPTILDRATMTRNCGHFIDCLLAGEHYIAPSVTEAERLRARVAELEAENAAMAEELIRAERGDDPCTS